LKSKTVFTSDILFLSVGKKDNHSPVFSAYFEDHALFVCRKEGPNTNLLPFKTTGPLFRQEAIARALDESLIPVNADV